MDDLTAKIRAALDDDERVAREAHYDGQHWYAEEELVERWPDDEEVMLANRKSEANHIARHDPARVLRQVATMRKILELHKPIAPLDYPGRGDAVFRAKTVCAECGPHGNDSAIYMLESADDPTIWYPCDTVLALAEAYGIEVEA